MRRMRLIDEEHGAAIVEFALVLPVLLLVLWGIVDIGRAFYTLNSLTSALREGARTAAAMATKPDIAANQTVVRATVMQSFAPLGPPLDTTKVSVTVAGRQVTVAARYDFAPLALTGWTFPINRQAVFRWEQAP